MSLSIDLKYVHLVSVRLPGITRKGDYLFNCRCPVCGDSKKNQRKMRGFIYSKSNDLFYRCHNCGAGLSLGNLIRHLDPSLYQEYVFERYKSGENNITNTKHFNVEIKVPTTRFGKVSNTLQYENLERCDRLLPGHLCLSYLESRKIPKEFYSKLYFTAHFKKFCDEMNPGHGKEKISDDERLVIPCFNEYNVLLGVSGRALDTTNEKTKYLVVRANNSSESLYYGRERMNKNETVHIIEGQLDSLFIKNCLAACSSDLVSIAEKISAPKKVLIFDNEPRNKEIVNLMQEAIRLNYSIVIWPNTTRGKDINEMVQNGVAISKIHQIISSNTVKGIEAQARFIFWKKIK